MLSVWWFGQAGKWGGFFSQKEKESPRQEKEKSNNRKRGKRERAKKGRRRRMHQASMPNEMTGAARLQAVMLKKQLRRRMIFRNWRTFKAYNITRERMRSRQVPHRPSKRLLEFDSGCFFFRAEGRREEEQNIHWGRHQSCQDVDWREWGDPTWHWNFDSKKNCFSKSRTKSRAKDTSFPWCTVTQTKQMMLVASSGYLFNAQVRLC